MKLIEHFNTFMTDVVNLMRRAVGEFIERPGPLARPDLPLRRAGAGKAVT